MKKLLVVLAVLSLFASFAVASSTRLDGLGLNSNLFGQDAWMATDASNVKIFPATILNYSKLAMLEYESNDMDSYVNMDLLGGVVGLYTNYTFGNIIYGNNINSAVLYGRKLSDTMSIAAGVSYSQYLDKQVQNPTEDPVTNDQNIYVNQFQNTVGVNLGLSLLGDIPMDFGFAVALPLSIYNEDTSFDTDGKKTQFQQDKNSGIESRFAGKATMGDMSYGVGIQFLYWGAEAVNQLFNTDGTKSTDTYDSYTDIWTMAQIGAVKTIKLDKTTVFAGTQLEMQFQNNNNPDSVNKIITSTPASTYYYESMSFNVPLIIGVETKITDNWTLRTGAKKTMWNTQTSKNYYKNADGKITDASDTYTYSSTNNLNVNFGATFEIAAFSIDFLVNKDLILNGPEFISGMGAYGDNTTPWASKIALNFKW